MEIETTHVTRHSTRAKLESLACAERVLLRNDKQEQIKAPLVATYNDRASCGNRGHRLRYLHLYPQPPLSTSFLHGHVR